jgi:tRNA(Ile)-lysidine synthase
VELPSGALRFLPGIGHGLSAHAVARSQVTLRSGAGGERLRLASGRPSRPLKKLFQEAHIPHWARNGVPRIWCGERLAAIPGIGIAPEFQATAGDPGWELEWRPRFAPCTEFAQAD